jgi:predicted aspartyl protease
LLTALGTPCEISQAFHPASGNPKPERIEFNACWDTGATKTVITPRVVEACGLKPLRRIKRIFTQGVDGLEKSEAYEINLSLPRNITIHELTVVLKNPGKVWWDVLIGMDLISIGEFSVKNVNGKTEWSFSVPTAA